jgi:protein involved in polysaccharide export with SLBB domain
MIGNRRLALVLAGMVACGMLSGCYDHTQVQAFLSTPHRASTAIEYRVFPPDVLQIRSQKVVEIDGIGQQVRPDGKINLPLVGEIYVAGLTPKEIEAAINKLAEETYQDAKCTVIVAGFNSQRFYVFGQVAIPGPIQWTGRDSVLDALSRTQPTPLAWPSRIYLLRSPEPRTGGYATTQPSRAYRLTGKHPEDPTRPRRKLLINLDAMIASGDMANNVLLRPDDIIYVQPNPFARIGLAIETVLFPMSAATNALGDYRELVGDLRWIDDGQPRDAGGGAGQTIRVR